MKILCVIDNLGSGGAQRQLINIACGLKKRGHEVEVFVYYPNDFFKPILDTAQIPIHFWPKQSRLSFKPVLDLRLIIQKGNFDSVLAFLETPSIYAEFACIGLNRVKLVVSERNVVPDRSVTITKMLKAFLHLRADMVTTNSYTHSYWMAKSFPWLKNRLKVIVNGVDFSHFKPNTAPMLNIQHDQLRLLGLGRIAEQKNIPMLVQAIKICSSEKGLDVRVDWAGRTDRSSSFSLAKAAIEKAQLDSNWHWLGQRADVADLMHHYDALILPSLWEGLPNAVCEALSSGLPVLASNVSDNPRLVQNGITGFLFDPKSPEQIASAITRFAALSHKDRCKMAFSARAFAEQELSLRKCIDAYIDVFRG